MDLLYLALSYAPPYDIAPYSYRTVAAAAAPGRRTSSSSSSSSDESSSPAAANAVGLSYCAVPYGMSHLRSVARASYKRDALLLAGYWLQQGLWVGVVEGLMGGWARPQQQQQQQQEAEGLGVVPGPAATAADLPAGLRERLLCDSQNAVAAALYCADRKLYDRCTAGGCAVPYLRHGAGAAAAGGGSGAGVAAGPGPLPPPQERQPTCRGGAIGGYDNGSWEGGLPYGMRPANDSAATSVQRSTHPCTGAIRQHTRGSTDPLPYSRTAGGALAWLADVQTYCSTAGDEGEGGYQLPYDSRTDEPDVELSYRLAAALHLMQCAELLPEAVPPPGSVAPLPSSSPSPCSPTASSSSSLYDGCGSDQYDDVHAAEPPGASRVAIPAAAPDCNVVSISFLPLWCHIAHALAEQRCPSPHASNDNGGCGGGPQDGGSDDVVRQYGRLEAARAVAVAGAVAAAAARFRPLVGVLDMGVHACRGRGLEAEEEQQPGGADDAQADVAPPGLPAACMSCLQHVQYASACHVLVPGLLAAHGDTWGRLALLLDRCADREDERRREEKQGQGQGQQVVAGSGEEQERVCDPKLAPRARLQAYQRVSGVGLWLLGTVQGSWVVCCTGCKGRRLAWSS